MRLKFMVPLVAGASLISAPVLAAAQPARAAIATTQAEQGRGRIGGGHFVVYLLALSAIIAGIIVATKGNDRPNSP